MKDSILEIIKRIYRLVSLFEQWYGVERQVFRRIWAMDVYRYLCLGCVGLMYPLRDEVMGADVKEVTRVMMWLIENGSKGDFVKELNTLKTVGAVEYINRYIDWIKKMMRQNVEQFTGVRLGMKFGSKVGTPYRLLTMSAMVNSFDLVKGYVAFVANLLERSAREVDPRTFSEVAKIGIEIMRIPKSGEISKEASRLLDRGFDNYIKSGITFILAGPERERLAMLKRAVRDSY